MPFTLYITKNWDHMSAVAAALVETDIQEKLATKSQYVLGLATGNSPTGLYKHLAKACNAGRIDAGNIRSFNLDEYVGLPGENPQQRVLHRESYSHYMIAELFGLLQKPFCETHVPWGTVINQNELIEALQTHQDHYRLEGTSKGKSIVINHRAPGILGKIQADVLDAYRNKIEAAGGIDLQVVGVGEHGHVAFHECGIPFEGNTMLLVKLDDSTIANAVQDGHFASRDASPQYAVSMGVELVYRAKKVVLIANGSRKTDVVTKSILGEITCDVPISYGQRYAACGGCVTYVIDEEAAATLLTQTEAVRARGHEVIDRRSEDHVDVETLAFRRNPGTKRMG